MCCYFYITSNSHLFQHEPEDPLLEPAISSFRLIIIWNLIIFLLPLLNWYFSIIVFPSFIIFQSLMCSFSATKVWFNLPWFIPNFEPFTCKKILWIPPFHVSDRATYHQNTRGNMRGNEVFGVQIYGKVCAHTTWIQDLYAKM